MGPGPPFVSTPYSNTSCSHQGLCCPERDSYGSFMHPTTVAVAAQLRDAITRKGISYRQVEEITLISKTTLGQILTGSRAPNIDQLRKIAAALDVDYLALVAGAESAA